MQHLMAVFYLSNDCIRDDAHEVEMLELDDADKYDKVLSYLFHLAPIMADLHFARNFQPFHFGNLNPHYVFQYTFHS